MPADAAPSYVWLAELPEPGARLTIAGDEAHYLARVCRARPGDAAHATDGRGGLARVRIVGVKPAVEVEGETLDRVQPVRTAWALVGPPEGERGDWLVEKLAELGVAVLQPVDCERGSWHPGPSRTDRWQRLAVAALKQARRRFLLTVLPPRRLAEGSLELPAGARFLADPEGRQAGGWGPPVTGASIGLVGPSEGLTEAEKDLSGRMGFERIRLSDGRLRAETAAVAWAVWWAGGG